MDKLGQDNQDLSKMAQMEVPDLVKVEPVDLLHQGVLDSQDLAKEDQMEDLGLAKMVQMEKYHLGKVSQADQLDQEAKLT